MAETFPEWLQPYVPLLVGVATALVIFVVGWIASKWARVAVTRILGVRAVDPALAAFLGALVQYLVLAATLITALDKVGIATTSLVALLASAGLAIGLALQGNLGHFASGVMILFFRPFVLGDRITSQGHTGKVSDVGLFATSLVTGANEKVIIPNGAVTGSSIVNHTALGKLRGDLRVGVAYGTDLRKAMTVLLGACRRVDSVLADPEPSVAMTGFGASSLDFSVRPWANSELFLGMLHEVRLSIYEDLNAEGIEIPFDQIVVHQV